MAYEQHTTRPEPSLLEEEERENENVIEDDGNTDSVTNTDGVGFTGKSKTVQLGLMTTYAPSWTRQEGFREVYQNW